MDAAYKDWRRHLTADHAGALKNLGKDRPWMDLGRVGIWGFSWGGYTTLACLLDEPEVYRAGVSSSPGYDPYSSFLYEPYLAGVPDAHNKAAYDDALMIGDVGKLQGRLMIVAGTNDVGVWHDVVKMSNALIEARKDHELVMMPGQGHGYGSLHETYYIDKLVGHFERHVMGGRAAG
jgi:dipeptidyl aminopeptidase/acylaminoacyl peptidase